MLNEFIFWACTVLIFYIYAGYPLLLGLLARRRPRPAFPPAELPTVTLLIAAYNEAEGIAAKLENSLALEYPADRLQVLVAADGSEDETAGIVRSYARQGVELSWAPLRAGKSAAIRRAIPLVRGQVIVFSDANNLYAHDALLHLVAPFADPQVGVVSGAKRVAPSGDGLGESEGLYWKYESWIKEQETRLGSCTGVSGEILAVRSSMMTAPPAGWINDDFYLALAVLRRGGRVVYIPAAKSSEEVSATAADEISRRARIVAGRYQALAQAGRLLPWGRPILVWQLVSHKFLRPLAPFALLGALLANLAAASRPGAAGWKVLLALQAGFYVLALVGSRRAPRGRLAKMLFLPAFLINSNYAALLGLYRHLKGNQSSMHAEGIWKRVRRRKPISS